ncbi:hypothetical protein HLB27_03445 [Dickeya dadantii]|uniref:DUF7446 family protein n=1 Tax=Dickeya dadantii TaxID=204038 RepID=UPI001495AE58|nr:hypothetical protein [Dickeya dadantii]NPE57705.1 hypothetical protein [Dickeya dadantii]NPE69821.1 hypothetical protein [Dickeya dadantii]
MTELSNERLVEIIKRHSPSLRWEEAPAMARELLQRREAAEKPVATVDIQSGKSDSGKSEGKKFILVHLPALYELPDGVYHLFTAPALPVVPDAITALETITTLEYAEGWNACRAAMLKQSANSCQLFGNSEQLPAASVQEKCPGVPAWVFADNVDPRQCYAAGWKAHATAVGNSPVIPDGWALVPKEIHLNASDIAGICSQCGDGGHMCGDFTDGVLWVGTKIDVTDMACKAVAESLMYTKRDIVFTLKDGRELVLMAEVRDPASGAN